MPGRPSFRSQAPARRMSGLWAPSPSSRPFRRCFAATMGSSSRSRSRCCTTCGGFMRSSPDRSFSAAEARPCFDTRTKSSSARRRRSSLATPSSGFGAPRPTTCGRSEALRVATASPGDTTAPHGPRSSCPQTWPEARRATSLPCSRSGAAAPTTCGWSEAWAPCCTSMAPRFGASTWTRRRSCSPSPEMSKTSSSWAA